MPLSCPRTPVRLVAALFAAALALPACGDLPTGADSYVREAGGSVWVAISEPEGLPDFKTWAPFLDEASPAHAEVKRLKSEAGKARRGGRGEDALAMEAEAARLAASSLARTPGPETVLLGVAALESWLQRAEARLAERSFPELEGAAATVRARRDTARALLARGDTGTAVVEMTLAAEAARTFSPLAVALRVVAQAESRIDVQERPTQELLRARRLLRNAREGLATGDYAKAMQKALYAVQLIDAYDRIPPSAGRRRTTDPG